MEGIDFFKTFLHVAKITTARVLLPVTSIKSWHLYQLDVNNTFLHGDLQEEVYMIVPKGVTSPKPNQVCKLLKYLYGLKQASTKLYEKLTGVLLDRMFKKSTFNHYLSTLHKESSLTIILVYVEVVILAGISLCEFNRIKIIMDSQFKIKDHGQFKYFLRIEVTHSTVWITIFKIKYFPNSIYDAGFLRPKPGKAPLDPSI